MSYVAVDERPVDFMLCQYGTSKNLFRGPKKSIKGRFGVCLGGANTFGGKIPDPFSCILERELGYPILNLGAQHAGAGFYIEDVDVSKIIENAQFILVEAPSVINHSNIFYRVHPRRNDRFVTALKPLYRLFPEVDFVECHFTKHLVTKMITLDAQRSDIVLQSLRDEWVESLATMRSHWNAKQVIHWFPKVAGDTPKHEFPISDMIGLEPRMYDQVLQPSDRLFPIQHQAIGQVASQCDHRRIAQVVLDAIL